MVTLNNEHEIGTTIGAIRVVLNGGKVEMEQATIPIQWFFTKDVIEKRPVQILIVEQSEFEMDSSTCGERTLAKVEWHAVNRLCRFRSGEGATRLNLSRRGRVHGFRDAPVVIEGGHARSSIGRRTPYTRRSCRLISANCWRQTVVSEWSAAVCFGTTRRKPCSASGFCGSATTRSCATSALPCAAVSFSDSR